MLRRLREWRARRAVWRVRLRAIRCGVCLCEYTDAQVAKGGHYLVARRAYDSVVARGERPGPEHFAATVALGELNWRDYERAEALC